MKKNMSNTDAIIRFSIAIIIGILTITGVISGTLSFILLALSAIFILTGFLKFCPIYAVFGIKTCKTE